MHEPVLLKEVLTYLDPQPGDFMIDGTVDGGGHAAAIIRKIMPGGMFLGVDWDKKMIAAREAARTNAAQTNAAQANAAQANTARTSATWADSARERYAHGNYADLPKILQKEKLGKADGLLLDLGFSSEQLEHSGRGFSFSTFSMNEPLHMTYDDAQTPVAEILRGLKEEELAKVIFEFGGERLSRRIARAIVLRGRERRITTSGELAETVRGAVPKGYERGRIDPATRTFQALRIYANDELGNLEKILDGLAEVLAPGGRIVIISFHSLEDRIVKQKFQTLAKERKINILTKKPVTASREEEARNPSSRSAKLRGAVMREAAP